MPPMMAPISTAETASSSLPALRCHWALSRFSAPEMTPMSYPNSIPPIAATEATR